MKKKTIIILAIVAAIILGAIIGVSIYLKKLKDPKNFFDSPSIPTPSPIQSFEPVTSEVSVKTPEPTLDYYKLLQEQADYSMMKNTVNVLVIGVDYAEERETWNGKHAYHSDVMMVVAMNFDDNTVDMISLPRDTYAKIPGVDGIYKLNASIDCGGGFPTEEGFNKVCEAAEWMLGGIPVDYYYAVTMPAVKELGNIVGGVDYDLELDFTLAGRSYKKGMQHMDGQAILDYLRVRKNIGSQGGDSNRVNRQKRMLVALFNKMKQENLLVKIPQILHAFEGQLYTNTTFNQTASLALFGMGLNSEDIAMHSMVGSTKSIFGWNFCLTNQKKRVDLIKDVYNVSVPQYVEYSQKYAEYRWADMLTTYYTENEKSVPYKRFEEICNIMEEDKLLPESMPTPTPLNPSGPATIPTPMPSIATEDEPSDTPPSERDDTKFDWREWFRPADNGSHSSSSGLKLAFGDSLFRKYSPEVYAIYEQLLIARKEMLEAQKEQQKKKPEDVNGERLVAAVENYQTLLTQMVDSLGLKAIRDSEWDYAYWNDKKFNEVIVDFR